MLRSDERLRDDYLRRIATPKLHIGGGWRLLEEWLNTDIELIPNVMRMDATRPFPLPDGKFQFVYTEHMIEHVPYKNGIRMLQECHRVMRKGGVIRVITPDLSAIVALYKNESCAHQKEYLEWFCRAFAPEAPSNAVSAINAMFRLWGHQFIYDEETLAEAMRIVGFESVKRWTLGESDYPDLRNMENQQRYPEGLLNFESLALEAVKSVQGDPMGQRL
jgi:predicted SAM-dependent methyltransferase